MTDHGFNYDDWCAHIESEANNVLGSTMINWRDVTFNWAERFQDGDPVAFTVDALIVAAQEEFQAAIKNAVASARSAAERP